MTKKRNSKKKGEGVVLKYFLNFIVFLIKIPYYLLKGMYLISKSFRGYTKERKIEKIVKKKREEMKPLYEGFTILETLKGGFERWEEALLNSDSKIGIILGARGSGKSAFGIKFLENMRAKSDKRIFAMGFNPNEMPSWIDVVEEVSHLGNNAFVLLDEGGILFNSRNSMSNINKFLSELMLIARHKNLSILFISQNSSNLDINILRQADFLVLKPSSLLQQDMERKVVKDVYKKAEEGFNEYKNTPGLTHIYSDDFVGFVTNTLPSFWNTKISKSFE